MSLIGTFPASASAVFNLDFLPEYLLVGNTYSDFNPLSTISVVTSGVQLMSITNRNRISALAKFDSGAILAAPSAAGTNTSKAAQYLKLATGRINKATTIQGTNAVAAVENVCAASTNISNVARRAVEQSINPSANATFDNFEALFFSPTDVLRAQITFSNGFTDEYTPAELQALYARFHVTDREGELADLICIDGDSGAGQIAQVVIFNGAGGSTVVLKSDYVVL